MCSRHARDDQIVAISSRRDDADGGRKADRGDKGRSEGPGDSDEV